MNYFNFRGRANRREFWYWLGFVILLWLVLLYVDLNYVSRVARISADGRRRAALPFQRLADFLVIPTLSLLVRRMHDHDEPGWKALIILPLGYWLVAKGDKGPNRYG